MRLRTSLRIITFVSIVLLCTGFVVSLYWRLSTTGKAETLDLYTLIPANASTIVDTDDVTSFIHSINELQCSKEGHFLYVSRLFSALKEHINVLLAETPHGLSRQMNKMLISFHEPQNVWNQVFYCRMGAGDNDFVQQFIQKYRTSSFPAKQFLYKEEEITIYPLTADRFLACYFGEGFLVVSFQKRLIEQVIDTQKEENSILTDQVFNEIYESRRTLALPATIFIRENSVLSSWTEFNLKFNSHAIYLSGINHSNQKDDSISFMGKLRHELPVQRFPGDLLPTSTFFFSKRSASDLTDYFDFVSDTKSLVTCSFHPIDSINTPSDMAIIPVNDMLYGSISLENMCMIYPGRLDTIFSKLTGVKEIPKRTYYNFYKGNLFLAADSIGLSSYMQSIVNKQVIEGSNILAYEEGISGLSQQYNLMQMADMEYILDKPIGHYAFVPSFFNQHREFFRKFIISTQFTVSEDIIYPSVVFLYKGGEYN
ncbi:MAG: DUF3352 domain-containing protein [Bacteroides sp.]|nr:DUF3352 domain-containing protein [Bacteroides sp.]